MINKDMVQPENEIIKLTINYINTLNNFSVKYLGFSPEPSKPDVNLAEFTIKLSESVFNSVAPFLHLHEHDEISETINGLKEALLELHSRINENRSS